MREWAELGRRGRYSDKIEVNHYHGEIVEDGDRDRKGESLIEK